MKDLGSRARLLVALIREAVAEWQDDDPGRTGAAIAYAALFSVAPLLLVTMAVVGLLYDATATQEMVRARLLAWLGPQGADAVEDMLARALPREGGIVSSVVGLLGIVLGAGSLFKELRAALNRLWDVPPRPGGALFRLVREQVLGLVTVLAFGFLLLLSLAAGTALSALADAAGTGPVRLLDGIYPVVSLAFTSGVFALLFKWLPDRPLAWSDVTVGAIVTACLFAVGRWVIAVYLTYSGVTTGYGAAGSLVAFLVWFYYNAQIVLFGAEVTQVYARRFGSRRGERERLEERER